MQIFPRLKSISLSFFGGISRTRSKALDNAFTNGILPAVGQNTWERRQTASVIEILIATSLAGLALEELHCGYMDMRHWIHHIFETGWFTLIKPTLQRLQNLTLLFSAACEWQHESWHYLHSKASHAIFRKKSYMHEFIRAAPSLSELRLHFLWETPCPINLVDVVRSFRWSRLKAVDFASIETDEEILIDLFQRHASTIRRVALDRVKISKGRWSSALPRLRTLLTLDSVSLSGELRS